MKTTHTPGPWTAANGIIVGNGKIVADYGVSFERNHDHEANAKLIAASPDLLKVVERFVEAMKQRSYPELQGVACEAFAAIAKATGSEAGK